MTKLFVANATRQVHAFTYRVPDDDLGDPRRASAPRTQFIHAGHQIQISGDLTKPQVDAIIDQHRKYGIIAIEDIDRTKVFAGICYSVDKPISRARIEELMGHNLDVLTDRGRKNRELAAVTVSNGMEAELRESRMPGELRKVEMEVVEVRNDRSDGTEMTPERVRVARDAPEVEPSGRRSQRRKAA